MSNHYHLLVETPIPTLSRGMKRLNETYAHHFNRTHHRVGHLVQGRFKSVLVEREAHLLELVRYIVLNPVRAGMVSHAGRYRWSNYRATAGLAPAPPWLEVRWTLDQFRPGAIGTLRRRYRRFVAEGRGSTYDPREQLVGKIFLGGEAFCERIQTLIDTAPRSRAHPRAQRRIVRPSFDAVLDAVTDVFDESPDSLRCRSHRSARKAVAQLAWQEAGLTFPAIARWMGVTEQAVGYLVRRGTALEQSDDHYATRLRQIRIRLGCDRPPF